MLMVDKIKIGLIAGRHYEKNKPLQKQFRFSALIIKKIYESGGIPIPITFSDDNFNENILDLCDGFIFQGGNNISPYQLQTLHYAINHDKPVLGICLGMQTMAIYESIIDDIDKNNPTYLDIFKEYYPIQNQDEIWLKMVDNHNKVALLYNNIDKSKHNIFIDSNSILYDIYKSQIINEPSLHNYAVKEVKSLFKVTAISNDNVIEAIEYINPDIFVLGVQFHPELDTNNLIFERLMKEIIKRKNQKCHKI
jgi:putative glutamine amidotransferase